MMRSSLAAISGLLIFSMAFATAHALTPRDISIIDDRFTTERYPGGQKICGDHLCKSGEWNEMKNAIQSHLHKSVICDAMKKWKACESKVPSKN